MKKNKHSKRYTITLSDGEKLTAEAGTFNTLTCILFEASEHYKLLGCDALARLARKNLDCIHDFLEERHYYED